LEGEKNYTACVSINRNLAVMEGYLPCMPKYDYEQITTEDSCYLRKGCYWKRFECFLFPQLNNNNF
jgi:hypothetical protein